MYDVWQNALAEIEQKISPANFSTWFQNTSLVSADQDHIVISVKNTFYVKQLKNRYLDIIKTALINNNLNPKEIEFIVQSNNKTKLRPREVTITSPEIKKHTKQFRSSLESNHNETGLNQKYTLDNFTIGSNNDLAGSAAKSIIYNPGSK